MKLETLLIDLDYNESIQFKMIFDVFLKGHKATRPNYTNSRVL